MSNPINVYECREYWRRCYTFTSIEHTWQLLATIRNGPYAWPGGYPLYFITSDGSAISFLGAKDNLSSILWSIRHRSNDGWRIVACDINWEDTSLFCDTIGEYIESAYGGDDDWKGDS